MVDTTKIENEYCRIVNKCVDDALLTYNEGKGQTIELTIQSANIQLGSDLETLCQNTFNKKYRGNESGTFQYTSYDGSVKTTQKLTDYSPKRTTMHSDHRTSYSEVVWNLHKSLGVPPKEINKNYIWLLKYIRTLIMRLCYQYAHDIASNPNKEFEILLQQCLRFSILSCKLVDMKYNTLILQKIGRRYTKLLSTIRVCIHELIAVPSPNNMPPRLLFFHNKTMDRKLWIKHDIPTMKPENAHLYNYYMQQITTTVTNATPNIGETIYSLNELDGLEPKYDIKREDTSTFVMQTNFRDIWPGTPRPNRTKFERIFVSRLLYQMKKSNSNWESHRDDDKIELMHISKVEFWFVCLIRLLYFHLSTSGVYESGNTQERYIGTLVRVMRRLFEYWYRIRTLYNTQILKTKIIVRANGNARQKLTYDANQPHRPSPTQNATSSQRVADAPRRSSSPEYLPSSAPSSPGGGPRDAPEFRPTSPLFGPNSIPETIPERKPVRAKRMKK